MRIAALYDIHANLPALEAVIEEIRHTGVDRLIVGGDLVPGPMPRETLAYLLGLDIQVDFIQGNGEVAVRDEMAGRKSLFPEQLLDVIRFGAQQLQADYEETLTSWPMTLRVDVEGLGDVLFCHATPQNENDVFTRLTPEDRLLPMFDGLDTGIVVCGHTHMQFDRRIGRTRVVNAGSVGMPYAEPGAYWLLLGPNVELRRTDYDLNRAAERIRQTSYPRAEDFATNNVLRPPSEAQMLEILSRDDAEPQRESRSE